MRRTARKFFWFKKLANTQSGGGNYQAPVQPPSDAHKYLMTEDGKPILTEAGDYILVE